MMAAISASVWIIFLLSSAVCGRKQRDSDDEWWNEGVSRARCASRCLGLHRVATLSTPLQNNGTLGWCHHHKQCAKCLEPCSESWTMKRRSSCTELCERAFPKKHGECVTSCEFLQSLRAARPGLCPPPQRASGFAAACVESCSHDRDCSAQRKCCSNGCGHTCQSATEPYKGAPLKPRKDLVFEELSSAQLVVRWSSRFNVSAEPVVYVLQRRWNFGIQPSEDTATRWQQVAQTSEREAKLADIRPGRWYQFRVAAVNTHGTRGFTTPSRHFRSSREPSSPSAPSQLRVANMTFGPGRAVRVRLQWRAPVDPDLPVHHYKVSWSWRAQASPHAAANSKRRKTVRESQLELDSMRAERSYSVEVQAVCFWAQTELRSPRSVLHFSTHRPSSSADRPSRADQLDVGTPFYQDGQLRVHLYWHSNTDSAAQLYKVQWKPEFCAQNQTRSMEKTITQGAVVSLDQLLFSCKYRVLMQPLSAAEAPPLSLSFLTPSCQVLRAKSHKQISCPASPEPPPKVAVKATNLTAFFDLREGNVTATFSWSLAPPPARQMLTGYQEAQELVVWDLRPAALYRLEVRALTAGGEGPAASRTFQTPGVLNRMKQRSVRKRQHREPMVERH